MAIGPIQDSEIFPFLNFVLFGYVLLILFPRWKFTKVVTLIIPAIYSLLYLVLVIDWIKKNPTKASSVDFSTLRSIVELFKDEAAVFVGWTHYIAFDLMIARFIVLDAVEEGISHMLIVSLIPLTLMLGPIGLFLYSIIKSLHHIRFSEALYVLATTLCFYMVVWIFVFPGGSRFAFSSLAESHKKYWHENSYSNDAIPPTLISKYADHPDIARLHVIPAGIWAALVPIQLLDAARRHMPALHRWTGKYMSGITYDTVCMYVCMCMYICMQT